LGPKSTNLYSVFYVSDLKSYFLIDKIYTLFLVVRKYKSKLSQIKNVKQFLEYAD